ncbi:MAG: Lactate racemase [Phycisphaerae bacterium]|nr:Lactate racemase [Phycisphaerae bacterium]
MKVTLAYDTTGLEVELPDKNVKAVLRHRGGKVLNDPAAAIRSALANPIHSDPLAKLAEGRKTACILICDHTRPSPDRLMLPPMLQALESAGIARADILILVATGLHRPSTPQEIERMVGPQVAADYRIENHDARDRDAHAFCCKTADGIAADLDKRYLAAELKLATGFVEPHLMAGFGGGRKMVAPGVASADTICALHSPRILENRRCREGNLAGNPLHDAATEIARTSGLEFIVHVTMDDQRRITGVYAGTPGETFEAAVRGIRPQVTAKLPEPTDIVVTSGGGAPLDASYYQTVKGITAALPAVRPGGVILVASSCSEGLGSEDFVATMTQFKGFEEFRDAILEEEDAKRYFRIDQWQHEQVSHADRKADVILAQSMLSAEDRGRLWIPATEQFAEALAMAFKQQGDDATISVMPDGPYVLVDAPAPPETIF